MVYRILLLWLAALIPHAARCACLVSGGCVYPVGNQNVAPTAGLPNSNGYAISQGFFSTLSPTHAGVDLANGFAGGDVRAIASGRVVERRESDKTGFGWALRIEHTLVTGELVYSIYGHMVSGSLTVTVGDTVTKGQIIGQVDHTGLSTGDHLHFAIRNVPDFGCGYVPSTLAQCANDAQSNYRDPLAFVAGPSQQFAFLSFTEGNPGLPGDGILITAESSGRFLLTTPVPLGQASDGITITMFPGTGVSNFGNAGFDISTTATAPCSVQFGSATGPTGQVVFNGVTGVFTNVPQSILLFELSFANFVANFQHPGCVLTLSDLQIQALDMFTVFASPITNLDAAAIGFGQNAFPGMRIH